MERSRVPLTEDCLHYFARNCTLQYLSMNWCVFVCQEYIHRVGRTARGNQGRGHALLLLLPEELAFLRYLKQAKVS